MWELARLKVAVDVDSNRGSTFSVMDRLVKMEEEDIVDAYVFLNLLKVHGMEVWLFLIYNKFMIGSVMAFFYLTI